MKTVEVRNVSIVIGGESYAVDGIIFSKLDGERFIKDNDNRKQSVRRFVVLKNDDNQRVHIVGHENDDEL
jgi:hypothetical protein